MKSTNNVGSLLHKKVHIHKQCICTLPMALHFIEINAKMQLIQGRQIFLENLLDDTKISCIYVSNTEINRCGYESEYNILFYT